MYGVFFDLLTSAARSMVTGRSGARMVMSAGRAFGEAAAGDPQDARRVHRHQLDQPRQPDDAAVHQPIERNRNRRLEADDAERRAIELDVLLVGVMRRVIGGDDVDAAVGDALQHGVAVAGLAQRRVHLGVGVVGHRRRQHDRR